MTTRFRVSYPLRFAHCDPAGIAYYPRYFELCDAAVEEWTETVLGISRRDLHLDRDLALATVDLHARFSAPSRIGDWLDIAIMVDRIGTSSVTLGTEVTSEGQRRFAVTTIQVLTSISDGTAVPWPAEWREHLDRVSAETCAA